MSTPYDPLEWKRRLLEGEQEIADDEMYSLDEVAEQLGIPLKPGSETLFELTPAADEPLGPDLMEALQRSFERPLSKEERSRPTRYLPLHRTEANSGIVCSTCDGGGCLDCTDPA